MIDQDKRNAIYQLYRTGMPLREIARRFQLSRNTVREIVRHQAAMPKKVRKDKIQVNPELLAKLYRECDGRLQRVHERLVEEEQVQISYPTLTRLARQLRLGQPVDARCDRVPDQPGAEMQHDTSPFQVKLAGRRTKLTASLLYLRYSKLRYLKFYRVFTRFTMKCFLHEGLTFWDHAAPWCIIDNTNLARLRGSGRRAILVPEMVAFAEQYGFQFVCHEIGHANRKAGEERSFRTVETNFLAGRTFESLEDLNRQAFEWATIRMAQRVVPPLPDPATAPAALAAGSSAGKRQVVCRPARQRRVLDGRGKGSATGRRRTARHRHARLARHGPRQLEGWWLLLDRRQRWAGDRPLRIGHRRHQLLRDLSLADLHLDRRRARQPTSLLASEPENSHPASGRIFPSVTERKCACEKVDNLGKTRQIEHARSDLHSVLLSYERWQPPV